MREQTTIRYNWLAVVLIALISSLLVACGSSTPPPTPTPPPVADELIFYDWGDGIPQPVIDAFTEQYGVKVTYLAYETQEEALENIRAGEVYDLVVLDNNFLPESIRDGLLAEIDFRNIPNFKYILANFRDLSYDPGNKHSVPFTWGTTAFLVRSELEESATSWADLWKLHSKGKIAMRDEPRETIGLALKSLGYSLNSEDPAELEAALAHLLEIKEDIIFVDSYSENAVPLLASGEAVVLVGWVEDILYAQEENEPLVYVFPKDGTILWGDSFVIPANSPRKKTAELFLNFILDPEMNAQIVNETYYATAHDAVAEFTEPEIRDDPLIFPPKEVLKNAEVTLSLSPEGTELHNDIWERLKAEIQ